MDAQTFLDNFATIADAPGGVQRLRKLVIALGVSGGLGTQAVGDPPPEAPSALTGGGLGDLPSSWVRSPLGELVEHQLGKMLNKRTMSGESVRYLRSVNVLDGRIDLTDINEMLLEESEHQKFSIRDQDVLVVEGGDAGRAAIWEGPNPEGLVFQNQLHRLRAKQHVSPRFLLLVLRHFRYTGHLAELSTGVTIKHLSATSLRALALPVPPLAEQVRIVAKVDELMALCDELEAAQQQREHTAALARTSALHALTTADTDTARAAAWSRVSGQWSIIASSADCADEFRDLVRQLLVAGRLSEQRHSDEPVHTLVQRSQDERTRLVAARETKVVPDDKSYERTSPLPKGWEWVALQDIVRFIDYRGRTPSKTPHGVPLITAKNIRRGFISRTPEEFIAEGDYENWMTRGIPRVGDVLFTTEAPMGNAALIRDSTRFALAQRTINLAPLADVSGAYLEQVLLSPWFAAELAQRATGMTATGIKAAKLRLIRIPVPPREEQERAAATAAWLLELIDNLEHSLDEHRYSATAASRCVSSMARDERGGHEN